MVGGFDGGHQSREITMSLIDRVKKFSPVQRAALCSRLNTELGPTAEKRLVAYLVSPDRPTAADLRSFLREKLPDYMVPSAFVFLDAFPLTPNGKIDRNALPQPDEQKSAVDVNSASTLSPIEEKLAGIWREVLRVDHVSVGDNFFDLGGHSLLAIQVMARVRDLFQVELPLRVIFETPTLAGFTQAVVGHILSNEINAGASELVEQVSELNDDEAKRLLQQEQPVRA